MNSNTQFDDVSSLLNKDELLLKNLADKYPWCSVAQLYLLKNYKKNNSQQFEKQGAKTALFFKSSHWLNWQLHLLSEEQKEVKITEPINQNLHAENIIPNETEVNTDNNLSLNSSETNSNDDIIAFEPLHTVDYFASQGIKITDEPVTNDKLGTQMKSFTEWLKGMKKIHTQNQPETNRDEQTDKNIQQIAEHSNADAEIVTEAMADVLLKQNKLDKAIEVYEKLKLQNPAKSAYFAAKIQSLSTDRQN